MNDSLISAAQVGDIDLLYKLIQMQPYVLEHTDFMPFVDTPLHVAAASGHTSFATEITRLKPSFAWKLNQCGLSPMHLALQNKQYTMVCRFVDINKELVRVKGREGLTPLHIATQTGRTDLVAKFLSACPASIEDVTVRSETALHIAVKYNQFKALEVLVGWLQRNCQRHAQDREKRVLNWQDEAGNTILHLSVLKGFSQAVKLLMDSNINKNAKNFEDSTALDIVEINQSEAPHSVEIRNMLVKGGALCGYSLADAALLEDELTAKMTFNEKIAIFVTRLRKRISNDTRNALLVVAILFATSTYEAALNPPGGVYQGEGKKTSKPFYHSDYANETGEIVGQVVMKMQNFYWFWSLNTWSFYVSILMICFLMPRGRISVIVTFPLSLFSGCYVFSMLVISPSLWSLNTVTAVMPVLFIVFYCWGGSIYIRLAKKLKIYGYKQKDTFMLSGGNKW